MSATEDNSQPDDPVLQPFREFWANYVAQANDATRKMLEGSEAAEDPQAWRQQWLDALSQSLDAYMRSPAFLQAMKFGLDVQIQMKRNTVDLAQQLRDMQAEITTRLDHLQQRLDAIEQHLASASAAPDDPADEDETADG